jgi:hypothetical protein
VAFEPGDRPYARKLLKIRRKNEWRMTGFSMRLERLEGSAIPAGIQHMITMTYVNPDGTVCGDGYRIEGPLPGSGDLD